MFSTTHTKEECISLDFIPSLIAELKQSDSLWGKICASALSFQCGLSQNALFCFTLQIRIFFGGGVGGTVTSNYISEYSGLNSSLMDVYIFLVLEFCPWNLIGQSNAFAKSSIASVTKTVNGPRGLLWTSEQRVARRDVMGHSYVWYLRHISTVGVRGLISRSYLVLLAVISWLWAPSLEIVTSNYKPLNIVGMRYFDSPPLPL